MDSDYLINKEKFEGPHPFELLPLELGKKLNYPTHKGVYAFIRKSGTKVYINDRDEEGSDIVKMGYTKIPLVP